MTEAQLWLALFMAGVIVGIFLGVALDRTLIAVAHHRILTRRHARRRG